LDVIEQHQLFRLHAFKKYSGPRHEIWMVASDYHKNQSSQRSAIGGQFFAADS
jgi:hypothetical protein